MQQGKTKSKDDGWIDRGAKRRKSDGGYESKGHDCQHYKSGHMMMMVMMWTHINKTNLAAYN